MESPPPSAPATRIAHGLLLLFAVFPLLLYTSCASDSASDRVRFEVDRSACGSTCEETALEVHILQPAPPPNGGAWCRAVDHHTLSANGSQIVPAVSLGVAETFRVVALALCDDGSCHCGADATEAVAGGEAFELTLVPRTEGECWAPESIGPCAGAEHAASLVLRLKLDEGAGARVRDASGAGHHGDVIGAPTWVDGHGGLAMRFDGISDYLDLGDPAAGSLDFGQDEDFTLAAWIKTTVTTPTAGDSLRIISKQVLGGATYALRLMPNGLAEVAIRQAGGGDWFWVKSTTYVADGAWHHLAASRRGETLTIYFDGVPEDSATTTAASLSSDARLLIGAFEGEQHFNGDIDDVRIYRRALDDDELAALASAPAR